MYNFKCDQFIVRRGTSGDEEKRGIATVDHFRVYQAVRMSAQEHKSAEEMELRVMGWNNLCIQENCTFSLVEREQVEIHL